MPMGFPLFLAPFLVFGYIFIEIAAFIFIGSKIGILPSLCLVFLSSAAGIWLLRGNIQGFSKYIRSGILQDSNNDKTVIGRLISCFAAILLIIPGFVSSFSGLTLFIPFVRNALAGFIRRKSFYKASVIFSKSDTPKPRKQSKIIDLEPENYHARDPENSPWRKP